LLTFLGKTRKVSRSPAQPGCETPLNLKKEKTFEVKKMN
jgi:hypothetical protein